ncbi:MAG: 2Fe-2S iron-sulfur cluster binding domain-containing protein [Rhodocyclaceae bacterium]|nr:MAG: 2Fe-2S iron-sulfur cluster binding domain-containing protein [Rhodocyclaceae bacterium]
MNYQIAVEGTEFSFPCDSNESILDAAQKAGFELPYSCRKGVCASCEGRLVTGQVLVGGENPDRILDGAHDGLPFCKTWPLSDLLIAPKRIEKIDPSARKTITATVFRVLRPTPDVTLLHLRFPAGNKVKFKAGQYLQVLMDDGQRRSFSMANPPAEKDGVQLHIRQVPGGRFSEGVVSSLCGGDKLTVELPYGDFYLREESSKPILFVATGTGFAPIKSMIEDALRQGTSRDMILYWGARKAQDLYLASLPMRWAEEVENFTFIPVLSDPEPDWVGRTGLVHKAVLEDHPSLIAHQVYACGNPAMTTACREDFTKLAGLPVSEIYCDAFVIGA